MALHGCKSMHVKCCRVSPSAVMSLLRVIQYVMPLLRSMLAGAHCNTNRNLAWTIPLPRSYTPSTFEQVTGWTCAASVSADALGQRHAEIAVPGEDQAPALPTRTRAGKKNGEPGSPHRISPPKRAEWVISRRPGFRRRGSCAASVTSWCTACGSFCQGRCMAPRRTRPGPLRGSPTGSASSCPGMY